MSVNMKLTGTVFLGDGDNQIDVKEELNKLKESGDTATREINQEDYDALSEEEQNNGTIYFIPDADDSNQEGNYPIYGVIPIESGGTGHTTIEDSIYTTARYRASSLHSSETNPGINGVIAWTYE